MTLNDWNKREDFKSALKAFFKSEAGRAVKEVLLFIGIPSPTMPPVGVDFIDWNATLNSRREGYYEAIRLLGTLSESMSQPSDLPAPWEGTTEETTTTTIA